MICVLEASTVAKGITSAFASASEKVIPFNAAVGIATRQPNHMLLSGAPMRIVARPPPFGRFETDGTGGGCCGRAAAAATSAPLPLSCAAQVRPC